MINNQLLGYVRQQLSINISREVIVNNLKSQGWTDTDIQEAFSALATIVPQASIPVSPTISGVMPNVVQMQTAQTDFSNTAHTKSKKIIPAIFILIILCLAGGAAAYAYYAGVFVTLPGLFSEYTSRAQALTSFKVDINLGVDFSEIKSINNQLSSVPFLSINATNLNLAFLASYDASDRNDMKVSSTVSVTLGSLSAEAQMIILNNTVYAELTKIPALGILPMPMLETYKNKWFSSVNQSLTNQNPINQFTAGESNYMQKMFQDAHIIKTSTRLPTETIAGEPSYHFSFDLDREALVVYMQSYKSYVDSIKKSDSRLSTFSPESFRKALDQVKDFKGEIWIGRNDKLIHKLSINFGVQPDTTKDEQVKVSLVGVVSDYNQPVSIVAPVDSVPFQTLVTASLGGTQQKGNEAAIKARLSTIRTLAETLYSNQNSSYSGLCLRLGDTYRKAIEASGGTGFVCKDAPKAYAIGVKLPGSGGNWCIDSTGFSKTTTTLPSVTVCPVK